MSKWVNPRTKRLGYIDRIRKAYIMYKDIPIAELYHEYCSMDGDFDWRFVPIWENWDLAYNKYNIMVSITGLNEDLRLPEYIRRSYNPEFVTQRTIPTGREDLFPMLADIKLNYNDLFEVMCRTHAACGNDDLYVSRTPDKIIDVGNIIGYENVLKSYDIPNPDNTDSYGWLAEPIINDDGTEYWSAKNRIED